jgi:transglutaminase-like putative cysteine protease
MKLAAPTAARVTYEQLRWMSVCLALALAVHITSLPLWLLATIAAAIAIRLALSARGYAAPSLAIRTIVAVVSIGILFLRLRTFNGVVAGSALLSLVAGLKLFESQTRRDLYVVALIVYFLSLAALLTSESFWLLAYLLAVSWLTSAALLRLTHSSQSTGWWRSARYAGRISAQALPLALVLWLFFPRFDGPLWRVPSDSRSAETGLSDTMSPGDITDLALSDEVAFRVHFEAVTPPAAERYWRGPVLHDFDGRTWRRSVALRSSAPDLTPVGPAYHYLVSLEPNQHNWIFALDWPDQWNLSDAYLTSDDMLVRPALLSHPIDVSISSHTHVQSAQPLSEVMRRRDTRLPAQRNPRTQQLALELRRTHADDLGYVNAVLDLFRRQPFFYTLEPPPLGPNSIDEFLFDTKRGFCGHYASAFAALMRAAGIPARVVTGYHGGSYNRFADYWIVSQSDAHAWDEVWIEGHGWMRFDPTSAIAPGRVEPGSDRSLAGNARLSGPWRQPLSWLSDARLQFDALRQLWRERILRFDQRSQDRLLSSLGIPDPDGEKIAMVMGAGLALVFIWLTWQIRREQRPDPKDPVLRAYGKLCRKLAAAGLPRRPYEGPESFAARVAVERPDLGPRVGALLKRYSHLRYGTNRRTRTERWFIARVRTFKPRGILPGSKESRRG